MGLDVRFYIVHTKDSMREPHPRFWHSAVSVQGKIYVRGGSTPQFDTDECKKELTTTIEEYDPINQVWYQLKQQEYFTLDSLLLRSLQLETICMRMVDLMAVSFMLF